MISYKNFYVSLAGLEKIIISIDNSKRITLPYKVTTQCVSLQSIADTSIKRTISLQPTLMLKVVFTHV